MTSHLSKMSADNNKAMSLQKKKPKWESAEADLLVETVVSHNNLDRKFTPGYTAADRSRFWREATEKINAVGGHERTTQQVEKKWRDLKSQTKSKEVRRRDEMRKTGGGVANVTKLSATEEKILCKIPSCTVEGIPGGKDTYITVTDDSDATFSTQFDVDVDSMQSRTERLIHSAIERTIERHVVAQDELEESTSDESGNDRSGSKRRLGDESKESTSKESGNDRSGSKRRLGGSISEYVMNMEGQQLAELQSINHTLKSIDSSLKELVHLKKKKMENYVELVNFEI